MCAKLSAYARAVSCGRGVVHVCACVAETVRVKFGEDCVRMLGCLGGKWEGRCNDSWGDCRVGTPMVSCGVQWVNELWECKNCECVCFQVGGFMGFSGGPQHEDGGTFGGTDCS